MKCKQCNDVSTLAEKYSSVFKKTAVNSERVTHESYIKLISWVAVYKYSPPPPPINVLVTALDITDNFL